MKHLPCALLLGAVGLVTASARIGENEAQITARYGKTIGDIPTATFGKVRGFMQPGYLVGVAFVDGSSDMEMFSKTDQSDMTSAEIENLLKASGTGEWKAEETGKANWKRWRCADGSRVALYDSARHFLYINSKKFFEAQSQKPGG